MRFLVRCAVRFLSRSVLPCLLKFIPCPHGKVLVQVLAQVLVQVMAQVPDQVLTWHGRCPAGTMAAHDRHTAGTVAAHRRQLGPICWCMFFLRYLY